MSKPTIEEQITAVAVLRNFARTIASMANPTTGELEAASAINTLDDADLFADLDQERNDREAATRPCPIHPEEPDDAGCGVEEMTARTMAALLGVPLTGALAPEHNIPHDRSRLEN